MVLDVAAKDYSVQKFKDLEQRLEEHLPLLATLPPDGRQKKLALVVAVLLLISFVAMIPFGRIQLPPIGPYILVVDTTILVIDSITAAFLFVQFSVLRSLSLLTLAGGYVFTAFMIVPHALTFPNALAPDGLLDAGLQTTGWLYVFWHMGLPSAVIVYALIKPVDDKMRIPQGGARTAILVTVFVVFLLTCELIWLTTKEVKYLPAIMSDVINPQFAWHFVPPVFLSVIAIVLLLLQKRSVLELWLLVALAAWLFDALMFNNLITRFSLAWYAGRVFSLLAVSFVFFVLLSETTVLYAQLALATARSQREHDSRLMTMDAVAASIAHEVNQPIGAIAMNAMAGLRWVKRPEPDLVEISSSFELIVKDCHRAKDVISSIRAMFGRGRNERELLDLNDLLRDTIFSVRGELEIQRVSLQLDLGDELPQVLADRIQLQETFLNLFTNAVDAMSPVMNRQRLLSVKSQRCDPTDVLITIADTGIGIDPSHAHRIFDAFFTTKSNGTGLGLALCRSMIVAHHGRLWVSAQEPHGTIFHVQLPGERLG